MTVQEVKQEIIEIVFLVNRKEGNYQEWVHVPNTPVSILYKSTAGRYRPVRVADGPITARYRFLKNASWDLPSKIQKGKEIHLKQWHYNQNTTRRKPKGQFLSQNIGQTAIQKKNH